MNYPSDYLFSIAQDARNTNSRSAAILYARAANLVDDVDEIAVSKKGYWRSRYKRIAAYKALDALMLENQMSV